MKGIIFNLLEESIRAAHGEDMWDALLDAAQLEGAYTSLGSYPDEDLAKLLAAASISFAIPTDAVLRWFGRAAMPLLARKYPRFFRPHGSARSFVLSLNSIIHPEVRKLYPGAQVPTFELDARRANELLVEYRSPRRLCWLAVGLIEGAALHFGEQAILDHRSCRQRGEDACVFRVMFVSGQA